MTREEAIKVLKMVECHGSLTQEAKEMAISALSADVRENIHGEWIEGEYWEDNDGGFGTWKKCSICGKSKHHKSKFCPNCGADMRGKPYKAESEDTADENKRV